MDENNNRPTFTPQPPTNQSVQPVLPQPQQVPVVNYALSVKKRRTGLIVGIVLGSIAGIMLIAGLLMYFLWWQNPKKMVTDAMVNAFSAKQMTASGQMSVVSEGAKVEIDVKSNNDGRLSSADVAIKVKPIDKTGIFTKDMTLNLKGVYGDHGAVYVKADGLDKYIDDVVDAYIKESARSYAQSDPLDGVDALAISDEEITQATDRMKEFITPIVKKIDGQWLRINLYDSNSSNTGAQCMLDVMETLKHDDRYRSELIDIYLSNDFLVIKNEVESKNGARGFEIDLDSREVRDKANGFAKDVQKSAFAERLRECDTSQEKYDSDLGDDTETDSAPQMRLKVWVDSLSHQLTRIEFEAKDKESDNEASMTFDMQMNKSERIEVPANARDIQDVIREIQQVTGESAGYGSGLNLGGSGGVAIQDLPV